MDVGFMRRFSGVEGGCRAGAGPTRVIKTD